MSTDTVTGGSSWFDPASALPRPSARPTLRTVGVVSIRDVLPDFPCPPRRRVACRKRCLAHPVDGHVAARQRASARVGRACGRALVAVGHQVAVSLHDRWPIGSHTVDCGAGSDRHLPRATGWRSERQTTAVAVSRCIREDDLRGLPLRLAAGEVARRRAREGRERGRVGEGPRRADDGPGDLRSQFANRS
jgi:hypothetical protein